MRGRAAISQRALLAAAASSALLVGGLVQSRTGGADARDVPDRASCRETSGTAPVVALTVFTTQSCTDDPSDEVSELPGVAVEIGPYQVGRGAALGTGTLQLPPGTYAVTAVAPNARLGFVRLGRGPPIEARDGTARITLCATTEALEVRMLTCGHAPAPVPAGTASAPPDVEAGVDRPGSDYAAYDIPDTDVGQAVGLCADACLHDARCRAWTLVRPGVQGALPRCWLKQAVPAPVADAPYAISGVVRR